jgi:ATP-binding cassette subfamily B protein
MLHRFLFLYLKKHPLKFFLLVGSLFLGIGLQLWLPQILRQFINILQNGESLGELEFVAGLFLSIAVLSQMLSIFTLYISGLVSWWATSVLRESLVNHCLKLDMRFHKAKSSGELIERIDGDITILTNFFPKFIINLVGNILLYGGILVLLFFEDWKIGSTLAILSGFAVFLLGKLQKIAVVFFHREREASAGFFGFLEEQLSGLEDIRACGGISYVMRQLYEWMQKRISVERMAYCMNILTILGVIETFFAIAFAIVCIFGAHFFFAKAMSIGTIYVIFYYINMLRDPLDHITDQLPNLQKAFASFTRINELLQIKSQVVDGQGLPLISKNISVTFDRVSFRYDDGSNVLDKISFHLQAGKVLGLLGRTGSGKTTLARLLLRFYDVNEGEIHLDGIDIKKSRLSELRTRIGFVTQDVQLFHGTIRDNITFFDFSVSDATIFSVLDKLDLMEWLSSLPQGLDTMLESSNRGLSAGQAQLLALVRIFLKDPALVILDEASSRLDPATEYFLGKSMQRMIDHRTAIIIAHRLKTLQWVDEIMILDKGQVIEYGDRQKLERSVTSYFHQLLQQGLDTIDAQLQAKKNESLNPYIEIR